MRLRTFFCCAVLLALTAFGQERKNVLFIPVDDLRPHFAPYSTAAVAPHLEKLGGEGAVFLRAYCQQAVCAPSRASLLTGLRPDTTKIYDLENPVRKVLPDVVTLPQHFKANGYQTFKVGKVYHHPDDDKANWTEMLKTQDGAGYKNPETNNDIAARRAKAVADGLTGAKLRNAARGPAVECMDVPDNAYLDGAIADTAIEKLKELKNSKQPFFLAMGFLKPHLPFCAPKKYWDLYDRSKVELAAWRTKPRAAPDFAVHDSGELRTYADIPKTGPINDEQSRELIHGYCAALSYMDAQLGRVLAALDELGLRDNTVVILWGDHGWHLGDHGIWNKHTNFENAVHAPLLVRAPGVTPSRIAALTEFVDIFPSLCELAGLPAPPGLEGISFVPLLKDPNLPWKKAAFSQYPRGGGKMGYTLTDGRHRYTEWIVTQTGEVAARELYDHEKDPGETVNVAGDAAYAETAAKLGAMLKAGWKGAKP
jgi:iduronate 2-sulfatase